MNITIIGAGNSGLAMAAHLSYYGNSVMLWNRTQCNIAKIMKTRTINSDGMIRGKINIRKATCNLEEALDFASVVLITTPANSHKELAIMIAQDTKKELVVLLNPGRTFGAIEFAYNFSNICKIHPLVAETQTIIYTCRKTSEDSVNIIAFKDSVFVSACNPLDTKNVVSALPTCISDYLIPAKSIIQTSIGNVGMILHCAPLLLNTGWTESEKNPYKYYYEGITPTITSFIENIDNERVKVAETLGFHIESTKEWMERTYHIQAESLYNAIRKNQAYTTIDAPMSMNHRYIFEDIPCGLVPLEALGNGLGLDMRYTSLTINLADYLLNVNFRNQGRNLSSMGIPNDKEQIMSIFGAHE